jgi:photosystem II stability/assembly factor-like uncharacterized protein
MKKKLIPNSLLIAAVLLSVFLIRAPVQAQPPVPVTAHVWRAINNGLPGLGNDLLTVQANPVNAWMIFASYASSYGDYGIYRTLDGGANWTAVNTGLPSGPNIDILAISPDGTVLYGRNASYSDGGLYRTSTQNIQWTLLVNAPPFDTIFSMYVDATTIYIGTYNNGIVKSTNAGDTWIHLDHSPYPGGWNTIAGTPSDAKLLYGGVSAVYKTIDGGDNWTTLPTLGCPNGSSYIMDVKIDPVNPNIVLAGDYSDCIGRMTDGKTWSVVHSGRGAKQIMFDPLDHTTVYAIEVEFLAKNGSVLKSSNNGQTWDGYNDGLPYATVATISIGPGGKDKPSAVYAGLTTSGVYTTRPPTYSMYLPFIKH